MNNLPKRIFFTGVPGSRWSGIAQIIEESVGLDISDRNNSSEYSHHNFTGHKGAYFGIGMDHEARLDDSEYLDSPWGESTKTRLVKSHDWAVQLDKIKEKYPNDWILMVYRPDMTSYAWWHEAGGFQIKHPKYDAYKDSTTMLAHIMEQNKCMLEFGFKHQAIWYHFGSSFMKEYFDIDVTNIDDRYQDCLISIVK